MINCDILQEAFTSAQNDMMVLVEQAKQEFYRPEMDREALSLWAKMPPLMREIITASNPKVGKSMDNKLKLAQISGNEEVR